LTLEEVFLSLFILTFLVAVLAFSLYGYLLVLLIRGHSGKFNPQSAGDFIRFLWQLLFYYIHRSLSGFFRIEKGKSLQIITEQDQVVRDAEAEQSRLVKVYSFFSAAYVLFFVLFIALAITFLYMVLGPFM
jgi:hypothetical protein